MWLIWADELSKAPIVSSSSFWVKYFRMGFPKKRTFPTDVVTGGITLFSLNLEGLGESVKSKSYIK
jgi:hypothetical protein